MRVAFVLLVDTAIPNAMRVAGHHQNRRTVIAAKAHQTALSCYTMCWGPLLPLFCRGTRYAVRPGE